MARERYRFVPPDPTDMLALQLRALISPLQVGAKQAQLPGLGRDLYERAEALLLRDTMIISSVGSPDTEDVR